MVSMSATLNVNHVGSQCYPVQQLFLDTLDQKGSRFLSQLVAQAKREFGRISVENDEPSIKGVNSLQAGN